MNTFKLLYNIGNSNSTSVPKSIDNLEDGHVISDVPIIGGTTTIQIEMLDQVFLEAIELQMIFKREITFSTVS